MLSGRRLAREVRLLQALGACEDAVEWLSEQDSYAQAWATCERGDWMLWLAGRLSGRPGSAARRKLALAACECARLSLSLWEARYPTDARPREAIEITEAWARGTAGASLADVRSANAAAYAAANASAAAYAAYVAYAANAAANASRAAAYAAANASDAAASRDKILKRCADIARKHYPTPPKLTRLEE